MVKQRADNAESEGPIPSTPTISLYSPMTKWSSYLHKPSLTLGAATTINWPVGEVA